MTLRKFECLNCHCRFEADDKAMVTCPQCQSDNIDLARFHIPPGWWKWCLGAMLAGAAIWLTLGIDWKKDSTPKTQEEVAAEEGGEEAETGMETDGLETSDTTVISNTGLTLPPTLKLSGKLKFENGGYSFAVSVKNVPQEGSYDVAVLDPYDNTKVIARSADGRFSGVPASEEDGKYDLAIIDASTGALLSAPLRQVGFIKQEMVAKMSKEELQQLIMSDDIYKGAGENKQLAPEVKISYTGQMTTAEGPKTLSEVKDMLDFGGWQQATVTSVSYDAMNRVSAVTIDVTLVNDTQE